MVNAFRRSPVRERVETQWRLERDAEGRQTIAAERRSRVRYPVKARVSYRGLDHTACACETGLATNLSSRGILVATHDAHQVCPGAKVEIKMAWGCPLAGTIPLNLVAIGKVVRCEGYSFAVAFERHEFRIMGKAAQGQRCNALKTEDCGKPVVSQVR